MDNSFEDAMEIVEREMGQVIAAFLCRHNVVESLLLNLYTCTSILLTF